MRDTEYISLVLHSPFMFFLSVTIAAFLYSIIFYRLRCRVFDPYFISLIFSMIGFATIIFLSIENKLNNIYLYYYLGSQLSYLFGLILFSSLDYKVRFYNGRNVLDVMHSRAVFILSFIFYFFSQAFIYYKSGVPILMDSRLDGLVSGGTVGLAYRVKSIFYIPLLVTLFYVNFFSRGLWRRASKFSLALFLVTMILDGSKSSFVSFISIYYVFVLFLSKTQHVEPLAKLLSNSKRYLFLALIGVFSVIAFSASDVNPLLYFAYRLGISGDIFYMSFVNSKIESLSNSNAWYENLFSSPLVMVGLLDSSYIPENIGFALKSSLEGFQTTTGPNSRFNVVGYLYLGLFGGCFLGFLLGFINSLVRFVYFRNIKFSYPSLIVFCVLIFSFVKFETDYFNAQSMLINSVVFFVIFSSIYSLLLVSRVKFK